MKRPRLAMPITLIALLAAAVPSTSLAQTGGGFDLSWSSWDAGGGISEGGPYRLASTIGQAEASADTPAEGTFSLIPGFLQAGDLFPVPVAVSAFSVE